MVCTRRLLFLGFCACTPNSGVTRLAGAADDHWREPRDRYRRARRRDVRRARCSFLAVCVRWRLILSVGIIAHHCHRRLES
eukprot:2670413-Pleurochrysis_carterae.AAC.2